MAAAIVAARATVVFLPPYSPDLNPIEKALSKVKARLRAAAERTVEGLWDLLGRLTDAFGLQECGRYSRNCGYSTATPT